LSRQRRTSTVVRRAALLGGVALITLAMSPPVVVHAATGSQTFGVSGTSGQLFTVPQGSTQIIADLFGANGGAGQDCGSETTQSGAAGGQATASLSVSSNQSLELVVGVHGNDGSSSAGGTGGFNGGGDGALELETDCPAGGGGGGGATDVRTGNCAAGLTCDTTARVLSAGGGGGSAGGAGFAAPGGAGGGANGANGTGESDGTTGGGGATQMGPGVRGMSFSFPAFPNGNPGNGAQGGAGAGGGGGGGGGLWGGGGGAQSSGFNGSGGGGGSGGPSGALTNLLQGGNTASSDGAVTLYWLTWSPPSPTSAQAVTFTSHVSAVAAGGTETFTDGSTALCTAVTVASDGTAACTATLGAGGHTVTATYTDAPTPQQAQFNTLVQATQLTVSTAPTPTPTAAVAATPTVPTTGAAQTAGLVPLLIGAAFGLGALSLALAARRRASDLR
jgi:hypothetical protein